MMLSTITFFIFIVILWSEKSQHNLKGEESEAKGVTVFAGMKLASWTQSSVCGDEASIWDSAQLIVFPTFPLRQSYKG